MAYQTPMQQNPQQQQQRSFFRSLYDRDKRTQQQAQGMQATQAQPESDMGRTPQSGNPQPPSAPPPPSRSASVQPGARIQTGGSPVGSDGRIAPSPAPAPAAPAPQTPNPGAQPFSAPLQFDQNKWQAGPQQGSADYNYWQWAIKEQTGNPDFWGTLKEGTIQSGSPNRVWVKSPNGAWGTMDKADYLNQQNGGLGNIPPGALYRAGDLGNEKFATYTGHQFNQEGMPTYQGAQFNVQSPNPYQQFQFSQFQAPNQQVLDRMQEQRLQGIMQNPYTMSDTNVAQLREMQKEQVMRRVADQQAQLDQRQAATGRLGSGYNQAVNARAAEQGQNQLLAGARDIALQKMNQDRQDELNAIEAASKFQAGQMGRASEGYKNVLAGQTAQAGEGRYAQDDRWKRSTFDLGQQQANADEAFRSYGSQADARRFGFDVEQAQAGEGFKSYGSQFTAQETALKRALEQQRLNQAQAQQAGDLWTGTQTRALQERLGLGDLAERAAGRAQQGGQFDRTFGENRRQFDASLGLDWTKFKAGDQASFAAMLAALGGRG